MENIIESTVNAEPVGNVEPQETEQVETTTSVQEEVAAPQVEEKPVQSAEENARFAKIRREAETKAKDAVIAEMYGSQGITTYAQYQEALQRQQRETEAAQKGIDPEFYNEFSSVKEELNSIKREKNLMQQEQQLSNDSKVGALFNEWKAEVKEMASQFNVDYDTAFTILARERIADVMASQRTKAEQEAIKAIQTNAQTSPGALSAGAVDHRTDIKTMSTTDFRKLQEKVLRGENINL